MAVQGRVVASALQQWRCKHLIRGEFLYFRDVTNLPFNSGAKEVKCGGAVKKSNIEIEKIVGGLNWLKK